MNGEYRSVLHHPTPSPKTHKISYIGTLMSGPKQSSAGWGNRSRPPARRACSARSLSRYCVASRTPLTPALRWPLAIGRAVGGGLVGTFASVSSDSARKHVGQAALCPSRAVLRIRTRCAGSALDSTAPVSVLDRVVSQAVGYLRLCFLLALPRIGERWFWPRMPRPGGPVFGLLAGDKLPLRASLMIPVGPVGGVEAAPASAVAGSAGTAVADGTAVAAGAA